MFAWRVDRWHEAASTIAFLKHVRLARGSVSRIRPAVIDLILEIPRILTTGSAPSGRYSALMPHSSDFYATPFDADELDAEASCLGGGQLYLWFPVGFAERRVREYLRQTARAFRITSTGAMRIEAPHGFPSSLIAELGALLTSDESADTRCVFKSGADELSGDDIARVRTLDQLSGALAV